MSDNLEKVRDFERKAEPIVDNGLRAAGRRLNALADYPYSGRVMVAVIVIALLALVWLKLG